MIIKDEEQYNKIPNGTVLNIVYTGDDWDNCDIGKSIKCIKENDKLYEITNNFVNFSERDYCTVDEDYSFIVIAKHKDIYNACSNQF